MTLDVEQRAERHRRRLTWIALAAVVVLAAVVIALAVVLRGSDPDVAPPTAGESASTPAGTAVQPSPSTPTPLPGGGGRGFWVPPARQVTLPPASKRIGDYPVGFPKTPQGAAAAEVAKDRFGSTLDYAEANQLARVYTSPDLASLADKGSTASVELARKQLGVPAAGPVPDGHYTTTRPLGVQWKQLSPDKVEVQVLVQADYITPERTTTQLGGAATVWQWIDEPGRGPDWRLVDAHQPTAELVQVGTQAFNDAGWAAVVTEDS